MMHGHAETARALVSMGARVIAGDIRSAKWGRVDAVRICVELGADINEPVAVGG